MDDADRRKKKMRFQEMPEVMARMWGGVEKGKDLHERQPDDRGKCLRRLEEQAMFDQPKASLHTCCG
jgi:hypothetical protein